VVDILSRPTHGLRDWLLQRICAVYLAGFLVYFMAHLVLQPVDSYQQWHDWIRHPLMAIASAGFMVALLLHGWVGMRDVVLDYVHALSLRLVVLSLIGLTFIGCGLWALRILLPATGQ
jgi:succinate dehydrogenase / fumarate reductase membrane anchor subunit